MSECRQVLKPETEPIFIGFAPAATVAKLRSVHRSIMLDLLAHSLPLPAPPSLLTFTCVCGKALLCVGGGVAPPPALVNLCVVVPAQLARKTV